MKFWKTITDFWIGFILANKRKILSIGWDLNIKVLNIIEMLEFEKFMELVKILKMLHFTDCKEWCELQQTFVKMSFMTFKMTIYFNWSFRLSLCLCFMLIKMFLNIYTAKS